MGRVLLHWHGVSDSQQVDVILQIMISEWLAPLEVSTVASAKKFSSRAGPLCVEFGCSLCVCVGSLWYFGLLTQFKDMHVSLIKFPIGVVEEKLDLTYMSEKNNLHSPYNYTRGYTTSLHVNPVHADS